MCLNSPERLFNKIVDLNTKLVDMYRKDLVDGTKIKELIRTFTMGDMSFNKSTYTKFFDRYIFKVCDHNIEDIEKFANSESGFYIFFVIEEKLDVVPKDFNKTDTSAKMNEEVKKMNLEDVFYIGKADNLRNRILNKHILSDDESNSTTGCLRLSSKNRKTYKEHLGVLAFKLKDDYKEHYKYINELESNLKNILTTIVGK